jgi:hypothetical protein
MKNNYYSTEKFMKKLVFTFLLLVLAPMGSAHAGIATFDDLTLAPESYWSGADDGVNYYGMGTATWFTSGDNSFYNYQAINYDSWEGFAYSNTTDSITPGMDNQYSAITGGGVNGSANYGVAFTMNMWSAQKAQTNNGALSGEISQIVDGFYITNTTYAVQSMLQGDAYAKVFGGENGTDADWFKLTIHGLDNNYEETGNSVDFYLADYRFEDSSLDYIIDEWTWVDLSGLGAVSGLSFEMSSSDGGGGRTMKTPAYFAMDDFTTHSVPVPASFCLLGTGLVGFAGFQRKKIES